MFACTGKDTAQGTRCSAYTALQNPKLRCVQPWTPFISTDSARRLDRTGQGLSGHEVIAFSLINFWIVLMNRFCFFHEKSLIEGSYVQTSEFKLREFKPVEAQCL